jgi:hypothetical protein
MSFDLLGVPPSYVEKKEISPPEPEVALHMAVSELYGMILSDNSQARKADNPEVFKEYFTASGHFRGINPNLILSRDLDNNALTWHVACDQILPSRVLGRFRHDVEAWISGIRNRRLQFQEAYFSWMREYRILVPAESAEVTQKQIDDYRKQPNVEKL